ncbi:hypothetical protein [Desulfohalovibrio reitneri]|uniref:hypothetical protein n=1 Tax=Desulfohalovibrio reitneri TaxID=1307759 RepID=UPI0004A7413F|nr:hypothetical protein [Desulfohalovibrio reitneri]
MNLRPALLVLLLTVSFTLTGCGITERGGPLWEPEDHHVVFPKAEDADQEASLPAGDYLSVTIEQPAEGFLAERPEYKPLVLMYSGFRYEPPTTSTSGEKSGGAYIYSFIAQEPGDTTVDFILLDDKTGRKLGVYRTLDVTVTKQ